MKKNLPREIVVKPKSGFIFDPNRLFVAPVFRWQEELNKAELLRVLPTWPQLSIDELLKRHDQPWATFAGSSGCMRYVCWPRYWQLMMVTTFSFPTTVNTSYCVQ